MHFSRPSRRWFAVTLAAAKAFNADRIPGVAASVTFYALLAIFPALSATLSLYGLFADIQAARADVLKLSGLVPPGAVSVIGDEMLRLAQAPHGGLGLTFAVSLAISLYSANAGMKSLFYGLTVAYEQRERRGFIALNLWSLIFTLAAVALAVAGLALAVALPGAMTRAGLSAGPALSLVRWPVTLAALVGIFFVFYRFGPDRPERRRLNVPGAVVAAIGWILMSLAFSWYVTRFHHFDRAFGSLGAVIGFMTWIWISVMVALFGAELNSEIGKAAQKDRTKT